MQLFNSCGSVVILACSGLWARTERLADPYESLRSAETKSLQLGVDWRALMAGRVNMVRREYNRLIV